MIGGEGKLLAYVCMCGVLGEITSVRFSRGTDWASTITSMRHIMAPYTLAKVALPFYERVGFASQRRLRQGPPRVTRDRPIVSWCWCIGYVNLGPSQKAW